MGKTYVRIIQAIALAAAVIGLLLTTPSIEARTAKKHRHKKMKIVFDGSEPAAPQGELGDEIVQPRASNREFSDSGSMVHLRGGSVEDLWAKSKKSSAKAKKVVDQDDLDNPDLIEPIVAKDTEAPASTRSMKATTIAGDLAADESAIGSFKKSRPAKAKKLIAKLPSKKSIARRDEIEEAFHPLKQKHYAEVETVSNQTHSVESFDPGVPVEVIAPLKAKPARIAKAEPLAEPMLDFDEVKSPAKTQVRPVARIATPSKIYLRQVQPVARANTSLSTRLSQNDGPSDFKFDFAFENTTSMGRKYELETPGGRNYMMKNELFVGAEHSSGWGAKVSADYIATSNDDATKDVREMGDPSLIISHPSLYKSIDVNVYGQGRYYLPVSAESKKAGLQQFAYSLFADLKLIEGLELGNDLTGRYYLQSSYADTDAFGLIEDSTQVGKRFDWFKVGVGQRTQVESHQATSPGTAVELYPFADLLAISNTVLEAKVYIPMIASGVINGAPGSPSGPLGTGFSNLQAEFFARLSF